MKLRPRLAGVASLVPSGSVVADIGTDHAYLPVHLVKEKSCPRVIAVEKSSDNCRTALETVNLFNLYHQVEVRIGDGLLALKEEDGVEVVVIAGLGGKTICKMLIAALPGFGAIKDGAAAHERPTACQALAGGSRFLFSRGKTGKRKKTFL